VSSISETVRVVYELTDRISRKLEAIERRARSLEKTLGAIDDRMLKMSRSSNPTNFANKMDKAFDKADKAAGNYNKTLMMTQRRMKTIETASDRLDHKMRPVTKDWHDQNKALKDWNFTSKTSVKNLRDMRDIQKNLDTNMSRTNSAIERQRQIILRHSNEVASAAGNMLGLRDAEREVAQAMKEKNFHANNQRAAFQRLDRDRSVFQNGLRSTERDVNRFRSAIRDVQNQSFFGEGFDAGLGIYQTLTKIMGIAPMVGVALSGIGSVVNALGTGVVALTGSLGRLAGALSVFPALYAAMGIGAVGIKGIMGSIVQPAMKNVDQLKSMRMALAGQKQQAANAGTSITQQRAQLVAAQATANKPGATISSRLAVVTQQQQLTQAIAGQGLQQKQLNLAQEQYNKLLRETPPGAEKLYNKILDVKDAWQSMWTEGDQGLRVVNGLVGFMDQLMKFMKAMQPLASAFITVFIAGIDRMGKLLNNPVFQRLFVIIFKYALNTLIKLQDIFFNLLPLAMGLLVITQKYTTKLLDSVDAWSKQFTHADKMRSTIISFSEFLERSGKSLDNWWKILKNIGGAFLNIFAAAYPVSTKMEADLVGVTAQFKEWTKTHMPQIKKFFDNSYTVLKALGRLALDFLSIFGAIGSDPKVAKNTVDFLDTLGRGLREIGPFAVKMNKELGPTMTKHLKLVGKALKGMASGPALQAVKKVLETSNKLLDRWNHAPKIVHKLAGYLIGMRIAMFGLGAITGHVVAPLARFVGVLEGMREALAGIRALGFWGGGGKLAEAIKSTGIAPGGHPTKSGGPDMGARAAISGGDRFIRTGNPNHFPGYASPSMIGAESLDAMRKEAQGGYTTPYVMSTKGAGRGGTIDTLSGVEANRGGYLTGEANTPTATKKLNRREKMAKRLRNLHAKQHKKGRGKGLIAGVLGSAGFASYTLGGGEAAGAAEGAAAGAAGVGAGTVFLALAAAVAIAAAAVYAFAKNFRGIQQELARSAKTSLKLIKKGFMDLTDRMGMTGSASKRLHVMFEKFKEVAIWVGWIALKMGEVVMVLGSAIIGRFLTFLGNAWDDVSRIWDGLKGIATGLGEIFSNDPSKQWTGVKDIAVGLYDVIMGVLKLLWDGLVAIFGSIGDTIMTTMGDAWVTYIINPLEDVANWFVIQMLKVTDAMSKVYNATHGGANIPMILAKDKNGKYKDPWVEEIVGAGHRTRTPSQQRKEEEAAKKDLAPKNITQFLQGNVVGGKIKPGVAGMSLPTLSGGQQVLPGFDKNGNFNQARVDKNGNWTATNTGDQIYKNMDEAIKATGTVSKSVDDIRNWLKQLSTIRGAAPGSRKQILTDKQIDAMIQQNYDWENGVWTGPSTGTKPKPKPKKKKKKPLTGWEKFMDSVGLGSPAQAVTGQGGTGGAVGMPGVDTAPAKTTPAAAAATPGYVGTDKKKGAKVAWDPTSVSVFNTQANAIHRKIWHAFTFNKPTLAEHMGQQLDDVVTAMTDRIKPIDAAAKRINTAMTTWLMTGFTKANSVLVAAGGQPMVLGQAPSGGGAGGGSSSPRPIPNYSAPAGGSGGGLASISNGNNISADSREGSGMTPAQLATGAATGNIWGGHPALQGAITNYVSKAVGAGLSVGATTDHNYLTTTGKVSNHSLGIAADVSGTPEAMNAFYNQMVPYARSGALRELIHNHNGWSRGSSYNYGANDHFDHVHMAAEPGSNAGPMGGVGGAGGMGSMISAALDPLAVLGSSLGGPPNGGGSIIGQAANSIVGQIQQQTGRAMSAMFGGGMSNVAYTGGGDMASIIQWAAAQYGADPAGMMRIAQAESSMNPNSVNNWDSNAMAGHPSQGLFQFIESTFNTDAAAAMAANPGAWSGVPMAWMDPRAQSLAASWAFANGHGGAWATMASYGAAAKGADFITSGPGNLVVGDNHGGKERVTVQPMSGPKAASGGTGGTHHSTVVNSNLSVGFVVADNSGMQKLTNMVGERIADDIRRARSSTRRS
jgi:hypothetical protein